jgi:nicotinamidase-related amidase
VPLPDTAILAIHFQNENCHPDGKIKLGMAVDSDWRQERLNNAMRLIEGAREASLPIIHVRLAVPPDFRGIPLNTDMKRQWKELGAWREGTWGAEFIEGLKPETADFVVTHTSNSAFHNTNLAEILFSLGTRKLICCGVSTAYAVETTVRHAADIGHEITVAGDACSTATQAQHENALAAMAPLARITNVDAILAELG